MQLPQPCESRKPQLHLPLISGWGQGVQKGFPKCPLKAEMFANGRVLETAVGSGPIFWMGKPRSEPPRSQPSVEELGPQPGF